MAKSRTSERTKKANKAEKTKAKTDKPVASGKAKAASADDAKEDSNIVVGSSSSNDKTGIVTIEHCKSWGAFRTRAAKIQAGVGKAAKVVVNEDKPRKGAFVVTVSGVKEPIVELLDLKRPFGPLKALDMEEVVQNVLKHL